MRNATEWTLAVLIAALGGLFLAMIWPFLLALVMGTILAVLTRPLFAFLIRKGVGPKLSAGLVILALFCIIAGPLSLFVSVAIGQARSFFDALAEQQGGLSGAALLDTVLEHLPFSAQWGDPAALRQHASTFLQNFGRSAGHALLSRAADVPEMLLHFALALAGCFFVLVDGRRFLDWCVSKAPLGPDARRELERSFQNSAIATIWATVAVALVEAAIMAIAFLVLGIPGVFLAAGSTFIFSWIPFVHSTPVSLAALIYLHLHGTTGKMIVMLAFAAVAGIADNVTRAVVLKGRHDMHPLLALIAILGGLRLFGLPGVFVGPVIAAVNPWQMAQSVSRR